VSKISRSVKGKKKESKIKEWYKAAARRSAAEWAM
jgi:hypothetical protein